MYLMLAGILLWIPAVLGLGAFGLAQFHSPKSWKSDPANFLLTVSFGLASLATLGTLANFLVPVSPPVAAGLLITGWLCFAVYRHQIFHFVSPYQQFSPIPALIAIAIPVCLVPYISYTPDLHYDAGLYHIQAIKWTTEVPLPPGLANLHGRFGFNSSWFTIAASLETLFLSGNSIFIVSTLLYVLYGVALAIAFLGSFKYLPPFSSLFLLSTAVPWLWMQKDSSVGSGSPDPAVAILGFLVRLLFDKGYRGRSEELNLWNWRLSHCHLRSNGEDLKHSTLPGASRCHGLEHLPS